MKKIIHIDFFILRLPKVNGVKTNQQYFEFLHF